MWCNSTSTLFLYLGDRGAFTEKGPIELMSEKLIEAAAKGDYDTVHLLLSKGAVNVNVADRNGHVGLIGAAVSYDSCNV